MNFRIISIISVLQFAAACQSVPLPSETPAIYVFKMPDVTNELQMDLAAKPLVVDVHNCKTAEWQDGKFYKLGAQVRFENKVFIAVHANNYDTPPTQGSWFWEALNVCP